MDFSKRALSPMSVSVVLVAVIVLAVALGSDSAAAQSSDPGVSAAGNPSINDGGRQNVRRISRSGLARASVDDQVKGLATRLALTEAQQSEVKATLVHRDAIAQRIRADASMSALDRGHALYTANSDAVAQIKALLSPEQLQKMGSQPRPALVAPRAPALRGAPTSQHVPPSQGAPASTEPADGS